MMPGLAIHSIVSISPNRAIASTIKGIKVQEPLHPSVDQEEYDLDLLESTRHVPKKLCKSNYAKASGSECLNLSYRKC